MEAATIAVLVIAGAFLGLCVWIEWHSRRRPTGAVPEEPVEATPEVTEQERPRGNFRRRRKVEELSR